MKKLLAVALLAGALVAPASAPASTVRECGDMHWASVVNITTRKMSCRDARATVRAWANGYAPNMYLSTRLVRRGGRLMQDYRYTRSSSVVRFQLTNPH